jgi:hypothetical protein
LIHSRWAILATLCCGYTQTLVDLRTQSKSVDFSAANTTKPFKSGSAFPATCSVGETFFMTPAVAGSNIYACTALNSWTLEAGSPGPQGLQGPAGPTGPQGPAGAIASLQSAGTGLPVRSILNFTAGGCTDDPTNGRTDCNGAGISGLNIAINGITQGTQPTLNLISGNGIIEVCANNAAASRVDCMPAADTAYTLSRATHQAGTDLSVISASGSSTVYTGVVNPSLIVYTQNQTFSWIPDVACGASPTLNINGLGPVALKKLSSGALVPLVANDCVATVPYLIRAHGAVVDAFVVGTESTAGGAITSLTGDVIANGPGSTAATIAANAVTSSKMAAVNTRRTCMIIIGKDNGSSLANADVAPQGRQCYIPFAGTVVEVTVAADSGTPSVVVARNHAGTLTDLVSSALSTAASGGLACSNLGGTTAIDGVTTCTNSIQNTSIAAGDWIETHTGTAGGTAKRLSIAVTYTVN